MLTRGRPIHNRGVHYAIVSRGKVKRPNGKLYKNDEDGWSFLEQASKCARWLGYVPFETISDERNSPPVIRIVGIPELNTIISVPETWDMPSIDDLRPSIEAEGFEVRQPYRIAIYGEKTSLQDVLRPISEAFNTDLYLPSGEISDTFLHMMAKTGATDGRTMLVVVMADCDPAGYQMTVSIAHKLRAFKEMMYPSLNFSLIAPALTVEQVKNLGLPSTPLKETEKRAAGWFQRYGVEQTEIDALATLQPQVLNQIVLDAIGPYYDVMLAARVREARDEWQDEADERLEVALDDIGITNIMADAEGSIEELRRHMTEIIGLAQNLNVEMPQIRLPEPELEDEPEPFISSAMDLLEAIKILRARKDYGGAK